MKKIFLAFILLTLAFTVGAQSFYAGGTIGFQVNHASDGYDSETATAFVISPELGYQINPIWSVGLSIPVRYQDNSYNDATTFAILPYVRGTFARVSIVDFFGEFTLGYGHMSSGGYGCSGFETALRPGLKVNFNDKFSLIGRCSLLSYQHYDGVNGVVFALNNGLELGVQINF